MFVSTSGKDTNTGTASAPLLTLAKARDVGSAAPPNAAGHRATIHIEPGTYTLREPLAVGSGLAWTNGGKGRVSVSGGAAVHSWQPVAQADGAAAAAAAVVWADASGLLGLKFTPRHLYVNGERARRARLPGAAASAVFAGAKMTSAGFTLGPNAASATAALRAGSEFVYPQCVPRAQQLCAASSLRAPPHRMSRAELLHRRPAPAPLPAPLSSAFASSCSRPRPLPPMSNFGRFFDALRLAPAPGLFSNWPGPRPRGPSRGAQ